MIMWATQRAYFTVLYVAHVIMSNTERK